MRSVKEAQIPDLVSTNPGPASPRFNNAAAGFAQNLRATTINPNAGNRQHTNVPIPEATSVDIATPMLKFGEIIADEAIKYQQDQAEILTRRRVREIKQELLQEFYGYVDEKTNEYVPGYKDKEMEDAVHSYPEFHQMVESKVKTALESMTPQQQAIAAPLLFSTKTSILGEAANWRRIQFNKLRENEALEERNDINQELIVNPQAIHKPDPFTGLTLKERFFQTFRGDMAEAQAAWQNNLLDTLSHIKTTQGTDAARQFFAQYAAPELISNEKAFVTAEMNLTKWAADDAAQRYTLATRKYTEEQRVLKAQRDKVMAELDARAASGDVPTLDELIRYRKANLLTSKAFNAYRKEFHPETLGPGLQKTKKEKTYTSAETLHHWEQEIQTCGLQGWSSDYCRNVVSRGYMDAPPEEIDAETRRYLRSLEDASKKKVKTNDLKFLTDTIKSWYYTNESGYDVLLSRYTGDKDTKAAAEQNYVAAKTQAIARYNNGEDPAAILESLAQLYHAPTIAYKSLPALQSFGNKKPPLVSGPAKYLALKNAIANLRVQWAKGQISREVYDVERYQIFQYYRVFSQADDTAEYTQWWNTDLQTFVENYKKELAQVTQKPKPEPQKPDEGQK